MGGSREGVREGGEERNNPMTSLISLHLSESEDLFFPGLASYERQ